MEGDLYHTRHEVSQGDSLFSHFWKFRPWGMGGCFQKEAFKRKMTTKVYKISWNDNCEEDYKKIEEAITTRVPLDLKLKSAKATMPCVDFKKIIPIPEEFEGERPLGKEGLENKARDFIRTLELVELAKHFEPEKAAGLTMASQEVQEEIKKFLETVKSIRLRRALAKTMIETARLLGEAFAKEELCRKLFEWTDQHYKKGTALIISNSPRPLASAEASSSLRKRWPNIRKSFRKSRKDSTP